MKNSLPLILYKLDGSQFKNHNIETESPTIYFYSYQNFDVKITSGKGILYSVLQKKNTEGKNYLETNENINFTGFKNFGYTLFLFDKDSKVEIEVKTKNGFIDKYLFEYTPINEINETNEHYNDLIINNYLPTLEELEPAIAFETNKNELIKRMLLDFKNIMRVKGTKNSIEKFFILIGFRKNQIKIYEEYKKNGKNEKTFEPDKTKDTKTGNYAVLYDNWIKDENNLLNKKNLPYRPFSTENFDKLFESLKYAIPIANKYFTLKEQDIVFFGITFSSNISMFQSVTSTMNQIIVNDVHCFRKYTSINLSNYITTKNNHVFKYDLVKNGLQKYNNISASEVKYIDDNKKHNREIFTVEREIFDDEIFKTDFKNYKRAFGCLLHLNITTHDTYITLIVENKINPFSKLEIKNIYCEKELNYQFVLTKNNKYDITVIVSDGYNNYEKKTYEFDLSVNKAFIDFELFSSAYFSRKNKINNITTDVDANYIDYIIKKDDSVFIDIINSLLVENIDFFSNYGTSKDKYVQTRISDNITKKPYLLPSINYNTKVSDLTQTIPVELTENWLNIICVAKTPSSKLQLRIFNPEKSKYEYLTIEEALQKYDKVFDRLFIREMKLNNADEIKFLLFNEDFISNKTLLFNNIKYNPDSNKSIEECGFTREYALTYLESEIEDTNTFYFICTTETGIELNRKTFDLYVNGISVYDLWNTTHKKIRVNYDFPLFATDEELIYLSDNTYKETINNNQYTVIKSLFTRLVNLNYGEKDLNLLYCGDIISARLNNRFVCDESEVRWTLKNSFTNETIYTIDDYLFKYRVDENICYTLICEFVINSVKYKIEKQGIFSSYGLH